MIDHTRPDLSDEEVDALCPNLTQNAAKIRHLRRLGFTVDTRSNGKPLVWRVNLLAVKGGQAPQTVSGPAESTIHPNVTGMQAWLAERGNKKAAGHGTKTRGR